MHFSERKKKKILLIIFCLHTTPHILFTCMKTSISPKASPLKPHILLLQSLKIWNHSHYSMTLTMLVQTLPPFTFFSGNILINPFSWSQIKDLQKVFYSPSVPKLNQQWGLRSHDYKHTLTSLGTGVQKKDVKSLLEILGPFSSIYWKYCLTPWHTVEQIRPGFIFRISSN